ncbi:MAG: aldehyde dehydrogenase family protein [Cyanobacteria bacterium]|nr:aldehyde dehydrogenase family protein [Cyanobacteriota bacterium]MDA0864917.1 aldehyde dehydrogenase family protein [Cyanobacteriota bacterium]
MTEMLAISNPATGQLIQEMPIDDAAAVAAKVALARKAQSAWAAQPVENRMDCLRRFRDLLVERVDQLAATMTAETGKPITQARNEILATPARIDFFLDHGQSVLSDKQVFLEPGDSPETAQLKEVISQDPLGVIANISAWNYPYFVGSNVFVPALLTGNAVLYKPSEVAAMTGIAIATLLHEAGIPESVFIPIIGAGPTGAALLQEPLDGVFFTGSYGTGQKIAQAVAPQLIKVQLELGGKDPAYVCDDADVAAAAAGLADGAFYNNGQSCCGIERIYVHTAIYDAFLAAFLAQVKGFKLGDPTAEETYLGPLSRQAQLAVLAAQVADAVAQGATLRLGGQQVDRPGWYFAPTVLTEVTHDMAVMRAESFGPIIGIQRVADDDGAIALMNDTDYGLTAAVYSADRARAKTILGQVNSGTAYWNCCDRVSPRLPWSGRKHSGLGLTLSLAGIETFLQPRAWHWRRQF